ncbi:RNA polymerase sigma factor [Flagellimonas nanhaiensis]|uniref:RNA polymerase sigma factor n=1 Tax=Flagellimonas nanhaiensis TaxID=2292706 RepID=A0A371JN92_9FLAO|nr:RNA polymerase sigma factor [Allomuricauda nanhaiensis]RDY58696.1 RNA polymerase sigma factor [Allomuricauda nanhaiensis]
MQDLSDNFLMMKVKSGDLDKLGLLYERYKKRLFGFFYNLGNNPSVSEDLVQNVFLRILKYRNSYTGEGAFTAWMFRMARNVNHDHYKKISKESTYRKVLLEDTEVKSANDLDDALEQKGNEVLLRKALTRLPVEKREILLLSKYREMRFHEIAEVLGCSEGAAKVRVHRALKDLRTIFLQLEMT